MDLNGKVYVAGHRGLVGTALIKQLKAEGFTNIVTKTSKELDLTDAKATDEFFSKEKPAWVFLAAAKVGGIYANNTYPVDFLLDNLKIQNNIIESAYKHKAEKLLFLGSSCIYPKMCPQPIKEEYLLTSALEPTNEPYALAKIAGIKLCAAFNRQYGTNFIAVMPSNLYGIGDNYHPENAHALPMLLRRFHEEKEKGAKEVTVWGTGTPKREFLFAGDLAEACLFLMKNYDAKDIGEFINIGTGEDCTIAELVEAIKETVGFTGDLVYDKSKPDGTPRKLLDVSRMKKLGWQASTTLAEGIKKTYEDFLNNPNLRK